jgi:hypothetical protein
VVQVVWMGDASLRTSPHPQNKHQNNDVDSAPVMTPYTYHSFLCFTSYASVYSLISNSRLPIVPHCYRNSFNGWSITIAHVLNRFAHLEPTPPSKNLFVFFAEKVFSTVADIMLHITNARLPFSCSLLSHSVHLRATQLSGASGTTFESSTSTVKRSTGWETR